MLAASGNRTIFLRACTENHDMLIFVPMALFLTHYHRYYICIPIFTAFVWLSTLLAMLITWFATGRPHYDTMDGSVPYISDIGADILKPLFVVGCSITGVGFFLCLVIERWLRHSGRRVDRGHRRLYRSCETRIQARAREAEARARVRRPCNPRFIHRGRRVNLPLCLTPKTTNPSTAFSSLFSFWVWGSARSSQSSRCVPRHQPPLTMKLNGTFLVMFYSINGCPEITRMSRNFNSHTS